MLSPLTQFLVGREVRVTGDKWAPGSRRATICYVNDDDTCDVIYQRSQNQNAPEEEGAVPKECIFDVLPFELISLSTLNDPFEIKSNANQLFQLQDYDTAHQYYIRAHKLIQKDLQFNVGQRIIISLPDQRCEEDRPKKSIPGQKQRSGTYICVTVSDVTDEGNVDVLYDEVIGNDDEEEGVPACRVLLMLSGNTDVIDLQRSLLMNLAKCSLKLTNRIAGWACYWSSLAVAFVKGIMEHCDTAKGRKYLCDAYFVKSKAMLAASRPGLARKASDQVSLLDSKRGKVLAQDIDSFVKKRHKQNKVLAKNVAEWVDQAMIINQKLQESKDDLVLDENFDDLICDDVEAEVDQNLQDTKSDLNTSDENKSDSGMKQTSEPETVEFQDESDSNAGCRIN